MNKKKGFTLSEIVVTMGAMGILVMALIPNLRYADQKFVAKKTIRGNYMNAYTYLRKAFYNIPYDQSPFARNLSEEQGALRLCEALTSIMNTKSASCSATNLISSNALESEFTESNIKFTTSNGARFYISRRLGDEDAFYFYLVFVDVNGSREPNSIVYTYDERDDYVPNLTTKEGRNEWKARVILPDIFAFALTENSDVCPLGIPEFDTTIMTARIGYFTRDGEVHYSRTPMAYFQAKGAAWGYYSNGRDDYNIDEVYTTNDIIRSKLPARSNIYADYPDFSSGTPYGDLPVNVLEESNGINYNCSSDDFESCFVFLDIYR